MPSIDLNLDPIPKRVGLVLFGVVAITLLLIASTSFFGDAVTTAATEIGIADFAKSMSPGNPRAYSVSSGLKEQSFREEDLKAALQDAEMAVALSPNDYMLWQDLARLRERSDDIAGAERALRKALELAPNYADVKWALGNVLLRRDKPKPAFELMRAAVESNPKFAGPAASIAWDVYEGDRRKVGDAIGESSQVKVALALYLAKQKRFSEAYEIWKGVPAKERSTTFENDGRVLLKDLISAKRFLPAAGVARDLRAGKEPLPQTGKLTNGGFEFDIPEDNNAPFDWVITDGRSPSVGVSIETKRSGSKSLALVFEGGPRREFRDISQIVAVEEGETYTFSFSYRSVLDGKETLVWRVQDLGSGTTLATSKAIDLKSDWSSIDTDFKVPEGTEGVRILIAREECPDLRCPISGTVWFDDMEISVGG